MIKNEKFIFPFLNKKDILEIFAFEDHYNILSYNSIIYQDHENKTIQKNLSDLILRNLFVDLKKFSQNIFETEENEIKFTNIKV